MGNTKNTSPGVCVYCRTILTGGTKLTRYCSETCRDKKRQASNSKFQFRWRILKHYGLSIEKYEEMLAKQNNCCAICKTTEPGGNSTGKWNIDHDHKTGKVRGLLCGACNRGIGMFKDNPDLLESARNYLQFCGQNK